MIRRRVIVEGHVQGVFFRQSCQRKALAVGVAGWIRNNNDGSVEAADLVSETVEGAGV